MDPSRLRELLARVHSGQASVDEALEDLRQLPFREMEHATVDHHRALRQGLPEVVFGLGKTTEQIITIARAIADAKQNVLVTRLEAARAADVRAELPDMQYSELARVGFWEVVPVEPKGGGTVAIVTAGTSDVGVAEEAAETLRATGIETLKLYDIGVAGIHRLLHRVDDLRKASAVIVIAGMEGALPSVVGGIVSTPVIAVPTSVGYGTALGGFTPLFAMLTSCANGVAVVNIDSGFGAAMTVYRMLAGGGS